MEWNHITEEEENKTRTVLIVIPQVLMLPHNIYTSYHVIRIWFVYCVEFTMKEKHDVSIDTSVNCIFVCTGRRSLSNRTIMSNIAWRTCTWNGQPMRWRCNLGKAAAPFMHSCSRYQCSCVTLINQISTEAVMWLLLCGCVYVTNALLT